MFVQECNIGQKKVETKVVATPEKVATPPKKKPAPKKQ